MKEPLTFEMLPAAVQELSRKLDLLLAQTQHQQPEADRLLTLDELINYLPEKPAKQTIYGKINDRKIPYEKHGKRLYFRQSTIDKWLANGRRP
jgi:hypothetical protein